MSHSKAVAVTYFVRTRTGVGQSPFKSKPNLCGLSNQRIEKRRGRKEIAKREGEESLLSSDLLINISRNRFE